MSKKIIEKREKKFWGTDYGRIYPHLEGSTPYQKLIAACFDYCQPEKDEVWLDVGCGSGVIMEKIWKATNGMVKKIIALDLSPLMLNYSKLRSKSFYPKPENDQIEFIEHNLSNPLPFKDNTFDGIIANLVLPLFEISLYGRYGHGSSIIWLWFTSYIILKG